MLRYLLVFALCGVGVAQQASVGIFLDFEKAPSAALVEILRAHTNELLKPAGIPLTWRLLSESKGDESFPDVFIIRFKGVCLARPPLEEDTGEGGEIRLAATRVREGVVLPWTEIECEAVRRGLDGIAPKRWLFTYGRSLAKVVSHELFHLLLNTTEHRQAGVGQAVIHWNELTNIATAFGDRDLAELKQRYSKPSENREKPRGSSTEAGKLP